MKKAISEGRSTLTEAEAKVLLKGYGAPVVEEAVAGKAEEAVFEKIIVEGGIPIYEGLSRAAGALAKVAGYYEFHRKAPMQESLLP